MGDTAPLMRDRNLAKNRGGQVPAPDEASEVGYRVSAENKSGKQSVEALINNQGSLHLSVGGLGGMSRRKRSF